FVESLVDVVPGGRTLLLVNFRPEYHGGWMQKSWYQQLPLLPLGPEAIEQLLTDLLGADPSLRGLGALIRERTRGNPFFIEEVVQSLVDQGVLVRAGAVPVLTRPVTEIQIPPTVQAVLAARIDRLGEQEKRVLQTAAVVGKTFTESILQRVLGAAGEAPLPAAELAAALRALTQAEFLYEQAIYPEAEYAFKHPLTQEVAYGAQLAARRARVLAEASGDVHTLAFVVHAAGRYKLFSGAPLEAAPLLEEGIAREDEGTDVGLRIWTREAQVYTYLALGRLDEALTCSDEALALGRRDPHAGLELAGYRPYLGALAVRGWILSTLGRLTEAARGLEQTISSAEQYGDWSPCGISHGLYARLCDVTGDVRAAVAHGRAAAEVAEKTGNQTIRVFAFSALGLANVLDEQWREALDALGQARAIARERRAGLPWEAQLLAYL